MLNFAKVLRKLRTQHNMTQQELALKLGVSRSAIGMYENGEREPDFELLETIADFFNVDMNYLIGRTYNTPSSPYAKPPELPIINDDGTVKLKAFPLVGEIACHEPMFINEENETIFAPETVNADFCVKARGDSMTGARIMNGDIVFIKRTSDRVPNGKIVAVTIDDTVTLKRIFYYPDENMVTLVPENPSYSTQIYKGEELDHMRILGVAVCSLIPFG